MDIKDSIRSIKDFPKKGTYYRDLTPLYLNSAAFTSAIERLLVFCRSKKPNKIAALETSGALIGVILAYELGLGFAPIRRYGKLPSEVLKVEFPNQFRDTSLEIQIAAVKKGERVIIVDDLIATGNTLKVATEMVESLGGKVAGIAAVAELSYLGGRELLSSHDVFSLVTFKKESEK